MKFGKRNNHCFKPLDAIDVIVEEKRCWHFLELLDEPNISNFLGLHNLWPLKMKNLESVLY